MTRNKWACTWRHKMKQKRKQTQEDIIRDKAIKELKKIENKYGSDIFRRACNRMIIINRQKKQREAEIQKAEKELIKLKQGKPITTY